MRKGSHSLTKVSILCPENHNIRTLFIATIGALYECSFLQNTDGFPLLFSLGAQDDIEYQDYLGRLFNLQVVSFGGFDLGEAGHVEGEVR